MEIEFRNFDQFSDVINEKNDLVRDWQEFWDREDIARHFYNGQPTLTKEEAESMGREEVTNHMIGYVGVAMKEKRIYRIYSGPGNMIEIKIDTGNPEQDYLDSIEMSKAISKAIRHSGRFSSVWRSVSGEMNITGRAPLVFDSPKGWCPKFAPRILVPKGTPLVAADIPYAFSPVEMSLGQLESLKKASEKKGGLIDGEAVDELIQVLKDQMDHNVKNENGSDPKGGFEKPVGVTEEKHNSGRKTTVNVWWLYEPETSDDGTVKINATLFTEALQGNGEHSVDARIIGHIPGLLESPESWFHPMCLDSEIGGVKTVDTSKGIAQLTYNGDLDTEELFNSMIEGDKARALPRFQRTEEADENEVLAWNANEDAEVPPGVSEFRLSGTSQNLLTPIGILMNNSANITGGAHSNVGRDQQLRAQAVRSEGIASEQDTLRMEDVYEMADSLFSEIVYRFCAADNGDSSVKGYLDIAWFRDQMKMAGIDYKALATKEFGRLKYMEVKARRVSGGGLREEEVAISRTLMDMRGSFPPEYRPKIMQRAVATITQDADFAEEIAPTVQVTLDKQKAVAQNEFDTIYRRALILADDGRGYPVNPTDIDQDHLPEHIIDLRSLLTKDLTGDWTQQDSVAFDILHIHAQEHLQRMLSDTASNKEAGPFQKELQRLATIKESIQSKAEQQQQGQSQEQLDQAIKIREQDRKDRELQLKAIDLQGTQEQRDARNSIAERNQRLKEGMAVHKVNQDSRKTQREEDQARAEFVAAI